MVFDVKHVKEASNWQAWGKVKVISVWCCSTAILSNETDYQICRQLVEKSDPELVRVAAEQRYKAPHPVACQRLLGKAMLRQRLSRIYPDVAPTEWRLGQKPSGQPTFCKPSGHKPGLFVSLAHTAGMVVCAVSEHPVGIDVESCWRKVPIEPLAARYFSAEEHAKLQRLPAWQKAEMFFILWTLKEAYLKAHGRGIFHLNRQICFDVETPNKPRYVGPEATTHAVQAATFRHPNDYQVSLIALGEKLSDASLVWSFDALSDL